MVCVLCEKSCNKFVEFKFKTICGKCYYDIYNGVFNVTDSEHS